MAEKFVGLFGEEPLDMTLQAKVIQQTMTKYGGRSGIIENSLRAEKEFLELSQHTCDKLREEDVLSMGLEDAFAAVASNAEEAVYLLGQASSEEEDPIERVVARTNILRKLHKNASK